MSFGFVLVILGFLFVSMTSAYAETYSQGGDRLTQEQKDYCANYQIDPCTQDNILAKQRIVSPSVGDNGITANQGLQPNDWLFLGIGIGSVIAATVVGIVTLKMKRTAHIDNV